MTHCSLTGELLLLFIFTSLWSVRAADSEVQCGLI